MYDSVFVIKNTCSKLVKLWKIPGETYMVKEIFVELLFAV